MHIVERKKYIDFFSSKHIIMPPVKKVFFCSQKKQFLPIQTSLKKNGKQIYECTQKKCNNLWVAEIHTSIS